MVEAEHCADAAPSRVELRRRKLIDTARKLFIANGFHATGMSQIARESGIAIGQIYRDFASKEDLVAALVHTDCGVLMQREALAAAIREGDRAQVLDWIHAFIEPDDDLEGSRLFAEIVAESSRNARIAAVFEDVRESLCNNLLAALALLAPDAPAKHRAIMADAIMTVSLGMLHHQLMRPTLEIEPLVRALQRMIDEQISELASGR